MRPHRPIPTVVKSNESEHNPRHEMIRKDLAHRLRKSCSDLSEEAFNALIDKILNVQLEGERRISRKLGS
jgi:hypothetical protein